MQVTAEQTDPCTIVLDIAVDEQQVSKLFDSVYREFSRYTNVPGFRPGKAPRGILERYVNAEKVRERTLEKLITDTYYKAIEEEDITPFRQPRIEPTDLEDKKPYNYKAVVPLEPQVTLGEYTGLTVEKPTYKVTDEDVETAITRLRESRARLERITDRGVQEGDVLIAESKTEIEGEENDDPPRRQLIQLGNNIPGFDEALLGMMPDEERVFELTYPEDHEEEDKRGKKAKFTVKLASLSGKKLPELDDDFAMQVAGVETVEELRKSVRERQEASVLENFDQVAEARIIEKIVETSTIYYPEALVEEEVQEDLRRLGNELRRNNVTFPQYLAQIGQTQEEYLSNVSAQAAANIRSILALRQVAVQEGLQVDDEQLDAEFDRLLNEGTLTEDQYSESKPDPQRRLQLANHLTKMRLHDFLFANNTINEVEQSTPPDPEAAEETDEAAE